MDASYIYRLLQDSSRVIIPNFGAFLIKDKAKINSSDKNQNIIISFNDFLKFNDGILIDYVALKEKTNKLQAGNIVNEFIIEIKKDLDENGIFIIEGVGKLYHDNNKVVKFSQQINIDEVAKQDENIKQEVKTTTPEKQPAKTKTKAITPKKTILAAQKPIKATINTTATEKTKTTYTKAATPAQHKETVVSNQSNNSNKWKWIFSAFLLIAIVITGLYLSGYFNNTGNVQNSTIDNTPDENSLAKNELPSETIIADSNKTVSTLNNDNEVNIEDSRIKKDSINFKIDAKSSVDMQEKIPEIETSKFYHLIAASCDSKMSADKYKTKLIAQGFDSQIINKKNGYFRVSYGSYSTKNEAIEALDILKANNKKAWYLYHKN